jgi:hypothetical protein
MAKRARYTAQEVYLMTPEMAGKIATIAEHDMDGDSKSAAARVIIGLGLKRYAELEAEDDSPT